MIVVRCLKSHQGKYEKFHMDDFVHLAAITIIQKSIN